jgi:GNAT superfamily N-acetyltransferase
MKKACPLKDEAPPGDLIYEKDGYAIHQLDGEDHKVQTAPSACLDGMLMSFKLYSQNLSLFAKLFLETKSVFFDASTFLYYTLVLQPTPSNPSSDSTNGTNDSNSHGQVVGFFSKEKMSWDNNNVACILVFPPWQRRGLGQILIAASYALGRREGRFGGPERPLSILGRRGYIAFWCAEVTRFVLKAPLKKPVSVKEVSEETYILQEDVVAALKEMGVLEKRKTATGNVILNKSRVKEWAELHRVKEQPLIDFDAFVEEEEYDEDEEGVEDDE